MSASVNILIVDDRAENLLSLEKILSCSDLNIVKAFSGNEALGKVLERPYACILLDVQMPEMDGFETARFIRDDPETAHVPIIFVTAYSKERVSISKGYTVGAVDYLLKPLDPLVVKSKVDFFVKLYLQRRMIECQAIEIKSVNEQLRAANDDLKQFAAIAAHDIKSPVATMVQMALFFKKASAGQEGLSSYFVDRLVEIGGHVTKMIDDLLEYSSVGQSELRLQMISVTDVINKILSANEKFIADTGAELTIAPLPTIVADPRLINHLFQNLILNAVKYRRPDVLCKVEVRSERASEGWHFMIKDNGIGISKEDLSEVFKPFRRVKSIESIEGQGIGLSICERIVSLHGGTIWVESEPGLGSTFHLILNDRKLLGPAIENPLSKQFAL